MTRLSLMILSFDTIRIVRMFSPCFAGLGFGLDCIGGWEVPSDNIIRDKTGELRKKDKDKTPVENMLENITA